MFENRKKLQGKFIYTGEETALKKTQTLRVVLGVIALLVFIIPELFIDQEINKFLEQNNLLAILQTYVILVFFALILMIYTVVCSLTRYRLQKSIPECQAPNAGFDKHTWASHEWQFILTAILALAKIVGLFFAFTLPSLILVLCALCSAVLSFIVMRITFLALKGKLKLVDKDAPEEETETEDETEDFYDDKD